MPITVPPQLVYHEAVVPVPPDTVKLIFPKSSVQKFVLSLTADVGDVGIGTTVTVTLTQLLVPHPTVSHLP